MWRTTQRVTNSAGTYVDLVFEWHGGTYIDVSAAGHNPVTVIHVWDHAQDEPTIPRTQGAFRRKVLDWIEAQGVDDLVREIAEHYYPMDPRRSA